MTDCSKGCLQCTSSEGCLVCYNSKLVPKKNLSLAFVGLGQQPAPKWDCAPLDSGDNCLAYRLSGGPVCSACKPGDSLNLRDGTCDHKSIDNCRSSVIDESGRIFCLYCDMSYPAEDSKSCLAYPNNTGKFANCICMGLERGFPACAQCAEGFSVVGGYCVSTPVQTPGCMELTP